MTITHTFGSTVDWVALFLLVALWAVFIYLCIRDANRKITYIIQQIEKDKQRKGMYVLILREEHADTDKNDRVEYVPEWLAKQYKVGDFIQFQKKTV